MTSRKELSVILQSLTPEIRQTCRRNFDGRGGVFTPGRTFNDFVDETQLVDPTTYGNLFEEFNGIVSALLNDKAFAEDEILPSLYNDSVERQLILWMDRIVKIACVDFLNDTGAIKEDIVTQLNFPVDPLKDRETLVSVILSFVQTVIRKIYLDEFNTENFLKLDADPLKRAILYFINQQDKVVVEKVNTILDVKQGKKASEEVTVLMLKGLEVKAESPLSKSPRSPVETEFKSFSLPLMSRVRGASLSDNAKTEFKRSIPRSLSSPFFFSHEADSSTTGERITHFLRLISTPIHRSTSPTYPKS